MRIKWLGHSAFLLTASDGTRIITDPYVPGSYDGDVSYGPIRERADAVTVSHHHPDHYGVSGLSGNPKVLESKGPHRVGSVTIVGHDTFHDAVGGSQRGPNTVFVFEDAGLRLAHLGDLGHVPTEQARAIGKVDVLLVPVGGFFTVDAKGAHRTAELLGAKVVTPMHYKTDKLGFDIAGVEDFARGQKNVKRVGSSEVELSADRLPPAPEIWVLEHAL